MIGRRAFALLAVAAVPALAGCVGGDTSGATHVRATQATLNGRGFTASGPATYWWEYGTSHSAVAAGNGTRTPTRGPESSDTVVARSETLTGLDTDQHYFFRACEQDAATSPSSLCGHVREFHTWFDDSTMGPGSGTTIEFIGSPLVRHYLRPVTTPGGFTIFDELDGRREDPPEGSTIIPGPGCTPVDPPFSNHDDPANDMSDSSVNCPTSAGTVAHIVLGPYDDFINGTGSTPVHVEAGDGPDEIFTGPGADVIEGGPGDDYLEGFGGGDQIDCGTGTDTAVVDTDAEAAYASAHGCETVTNRLATARPR